MKEAQNYLYTSKLNISGTTIVSNDFDIYSHENVLYFETLFFIAQISNDKSFIIQTMKEILRMINSQTLSLKSI